MSTQSVDSIQKQYYKRFAKGEQYLQLNVKQAMVEAERTYFWQERKVYNRIQPIIKLLKARFDKQITDDFLYGKGGLVPALVPIQQAYNAVMNRYMERINAIGDTTAIVEDGSVDVDALEEEGLQPGKILVYRQGGEKPYFCQSIASEELSLLENHRQNLLEEFNYIVQAYIANLTESQKIITEE